MAYHEVLYIRELTDLLTLYLDIESMITFHDTFNIPLSMKYVKLLYNRYTKAFILCTKRGISHLGKIFQCDGWKIALCYSCNCDEPADDCIKCKKKFCYQCYKNNIKTCGSCKEHLCTECIDVKRCESCDTTHSKCGWCRKMMWQK